MQLLKRMRALPNYVLLLVTALLVVAGGVLLYRATAKCVHLSVDGEVRKVLTHASTVQSLFVQAGVSLRPEDRVVPALDTPLEAGDHVVLRTARAVTLQVSGEQQTVWTPETIPANILSDAGVRLYPGDRVWVDGRRLADAAEDSEGHPERIRVERAVSIHLQGGETNRVIRSAASTLGEALWEAGIVLREGDRLDPAPESRPFEGMQVTLVRARKLRILIGGERIQTWAAGPTVGEALAASNVALVGLDYAEPEVDQPLPKDGRVRVVRVREEILVELTPMPFDTVYQPAPDLEIDTLEVLDPGKYGVLASRVRIRTEDGRETARSVDEAWQVMEPSPRVLGYGTKIVVRRLNTPDGSIEYWRAVKVYATSYSPCNLGVDYCGERTASGKQVRKGVIGVIRSWYNAMRGQPVYVPGYGRGSFEDIGAGFAGRHWIDLGYTDENYRPWHSWVTLYFLTPVPPESSILWILP